METNFQLPPTNPMATNCPKAGCPFTVAEGTEPGMAVALMTGHISMDHSQAASFKPTQIPRPELSAGETSKGWQYFLNRWKEYSQAANLTAPHITIQLLACLDPKLRRDVTMNATGPTPLREYTEPDLLAVRRRTRGQPESCSPG